MVFVSQDSTSGWMGLSSCQVLCGGVCIQVAKAAPMSSPEFAHESRSLRSLKSVTTQLAKAISPAEFAMSKRLLCAFTVSAVPELQRGSYLAAFTQAGEPELPCLYEDKRECEEGCGEQQDQDGAAQIINAGEGRQQHIHHFCRSLSPSRWVSGRRIFALWDI